MTLHFIREPSGSRERDLDYSRSVGILVCRLLDEGIADGDEETAADRKPEGEGAMNGIWDSATAQAQQMGREYMLVGGESLPRTTIAHCDQNATDRRKGVPLFHSATHLASPVIRAKKEGENVFLPVRIPL